MSVPPAAFSRAAVQNKDPHSRGRKHVRDRAGCAGDQVRTAALLRQSHKGIAGGDIRFKRPACPAVEGAVRHLAGRRSRKAAGAAAEGRPPWISNTGPPGLCVRAPLSAAAHASSTKASLRHAAIQPAVAALRLSIACCTGQSGIVVQCICSRVGLGPGSLRCSKAVGPSPSILSTSKSTCVSSSCSVCTATAHMLCAPAVLVLAATP